MELGNVCFVKFRDVEFDEIHYGIHLCGTNDKSKIICACCGGTFEEDSEEVELISFGEWFNFEDEVKENFGHEWVVKN